MDISLRRKLDDYGPLARLIGTWYGESGKDRSPEEDGEELNDYKETLVFSAVEDVDNAEEQELIVIRYEQTAIRIRDGKMIHSESGYYSWDKAQNKLIKSFAIPRGVSVVAGGSVSATEIGVSFQVSASENSPDWKIAESPFMQKNAKTHSYEFELKLSANELRYTQKMQLHIYGRDFEHSDQNTLNKVE